MKKLVFAESPLYPHSRTASACLLIGVKKVVIIAAR
jgi:hypothetical protein